jgi:uncharacterized protein YuzE
MQRTPIPSPAPSGLGAAIRVREVVDYLKLVGKRVCINHVVGVVKDLSDTGQQLILVSDSSAYEELKIPLQSIDLIEVLDADPSITHELKVNPASITARSAPAAPDESRGSRSRHKRKAPPPAPAPTPMPLRVLYDETTDSLYVRVSTTDRSTTKQVIPGATLDYDTQGKPVGIEFTHAIKHLGYSKTVLAKLRFKLDLDGAADRLRLVLPGISKEKNVEGQEGISLDFDRDGRLAQLIISGASARLDLVSLGVRLP